MHMSIRGSFVSFIGAALVAGGALCAACVTEDADPEGETGGTGGAAADTGGQPSTGGADTGAVACPPIADALLLDFSVNDGSQATFGIPGETFAGGTNAYPGTLTQDFSNDSWHVSGTIAEWAGLNFYFQDGCSPVDASAYRGITLTISGTVPEGRGMAAWLGTSANTVATSWYVERGDANPSVTSGTCIPASATNDYDGTCGSGAAPVPVSETAEAVELLWSDFTGGKPEATVDPTQITGFGLRFDWADGATEYDVDVTIDDFGFLE